MRVTIDHPTGQPNFTNVTIGNTELWFSYRTLVGFQTDDSAGRIVRENDWGPTTGKHLNYLCPREHRVTGARFEELAAQLLGACGLSI